MNWKALTDRFAFNMPTAQIFKAETAALAEVIFESILMTTTTGWTWQNVAVGIGRAVVVYFFAFITVKPQASE